MTVKGNKPSKKKARRGALKQLNLSQGIGEPTGKHIKERVSKRGKLAKGRAPAYATGRLRYVSPRYPIIASGRQTDSGAVVYSSSRHFHSGIKSGTFNVSGGMWDGLMVATSKSRARIVFRGRSEGQDPNFKRLANGQVKARGRRVNNALKGGAILKRMGVNVLANTRNETRAMNSALQLVLATLLQRIYPQQLDLARSTQSGSHRLRRDIVSALLRGARHRP